MRRLPVYIICLLTAVSCDYFKEDTSKVPVARVNESYLYEEDIADLVSEETSPEDSTLLVNTYINRWATQQLLIDQARINLSEEKLETFNKLVEQYEADLFTEAYKNVIVGRDLDSVVREYEYEEYYESGKENFRLKEMLVKIRYIQVDPTFSNLNAVSSQFERFNEDDQETLNDLSLQFTAFNFNDSIWVKEEMLLEVLPVLKGRTDEVLKKSNFRRLQDSLGVYLVKIEDVLLPNDIAPLSHVKPTIEQIILNRRKLELIRKLEKDITKDAIENKKFETYNDQ